MDKRNFLKSLGAGLSFFCLSPLACVGKEAKNGSKLNILFLGGRDFLGPTIINMLLDKGHNVTLLNRGITNPHLFKELPVIICDREKENREGLKEVAEKIKSANWDCVIDTWQKSPKAVTDFLEEFEGYINHYHYVSTLAVYDKWNEKGINEDGQLNPLPPFPKSIKEEFRYAIRKTFSEVAIMSKADLHWTIYRCHGIRSDRSVDRNNPHEEPYWPIRFLQGEEILVPKIEGHHIQMTDAKSLANFIMLSAENKITGSFNVAYESIPFSNYIEALSNTISSPKNIHWIPADFLIENNARDGFAYWNHYGKGAYYFDINKARGVGLVNRNIEGMIADQIDGFKSRYPNLDFKFGIVHDGTVVNISYEKEQSLIKKWLEIKRKS